MTSRLTILLLFGDFGLLFEDLGMGLKQDSFLSDTQNPGICETMFIQILPPYSKFELGETQTRREIFCHRTDKSHMINVYDSC